MTMLAIVTAIILVPPLIKYWRYQRRSRVGTALLPAVFSKGVMKRTIQGTTPAGYIYAYLSSDTSLLSPGADSLMCYVTLPFKAPVHLIGLVADSHLTAPLAAYHLEPVSLEGSYDEHFNVFAPYGHQTDSRYVLDPSAMQFMMQFCAQFDWEILDRALYFMSKTATPDYSLIDGFIAEIRPAIHAKD